MSEFVIGDKVVPVVPEGMELRPWFFGHVIEIEPSGFIKVRWNYPDPDGPLVACAKPEWLRKK